MSQKTQKILDRLEKMIAHRDSAEAIGNAEEAQAFAGKINELLLKYNLTMSEVEFSAMRDKNPINREVLDGSDFWEGAVTGARRNATTELLAQTIAEAHLCRILVHRNSDSLTFVGRKQNRELAVWMFQFLASTANRLSQKAYREARKNGERTDNFRASYWAGFIAQVRNRYEEERDRLADQKSTQNALVRLTNELTEVTDYVDKMNVRTVAGANLRSVNGGAYFKGREDGKVVPIRSNAVKDSGNGKSRKSIAS